MTRYKIVLVSFPFDDYTATKVRPALCLTEPIGIHHHVVIAFISSQILAEILDTDLKVESTRPDFSITGLHTSSTIRLHRLLTIPTTVIQRELGRLPTDIQTEVANKLRLLFGLSS